MSPGICILLLQLKCMHPRGQGSLQDNLYHVALIKQGSVPGQTGGRQGLEAITFSETKQVAYDPMKSLALAIHFPHVPHLALD